MDQKKVAALASLCGLLLTTQAFVLPSSDRNVWGVSTRIWSTKEKIHPHVGESAGSSWVQTELRKEAMRLHTKDQVRPSYHTREERI